jgi:hypothetical protein
MPSRRRLSMNSCRGVNSAVIRFHADAGSICSSLETERALPVMTTPSLGP